MGQVVAFCRWGADHAEDDGPAGDVGEEWFTGVTLEEEWRRIVFIRVWR